jgi:hypothetical protein
MARDRSLDLLRLGLVFVDLPHRANEPLLGSELHLAGAVERLLQVVVSGDAVKWEWGSLILSRYVAAPLLILVPLLLLKEPMDDRILPLDLLIDAQKEIIQWMQGNTFL